MKPTLGHIIEDRENDAIIYLVEEWDWGGLARRTLLHGYGPCSCDSRCPFLKEA